MKPVEIDFKPQVWVRRYTRCDEEGIPRIVQFLIYDGEYFVAQTWRGQVVRYHPKSLAIHDLDDGDTPTLYHLLRAEGRISGALLRDALHESIIAADEGSATAVYRRRRGYHYPEASGEV